MENEIKIPLSPKIWSYGTRVRVTGSNLTGTVIEEGENPIVLVDQDMENWKFRGSDLICIDPVRELKKQAKNSLKLKLSKLKFWR